MALKTCLGGTGGIISTYQSLQTDIQMESFFVINPIISTISERYRSRRDRHLPSFFKINQLITHSERCAALRGLARHAGAGFLCPQDVPPNQFFRAGRITRGNGIGDFQMGGREFMTSSGSSRILGESKGKLD